MVTIMRCIFFFSLLFLTACGKNEFKIEFELPKEVTDNYDVVYYATDKDGSGRTIQAVASIREGSCLLEGLTRKPTLVYLYKHGSKVPLLIYAKKGETIKVTGENNNPFDWKVEGNEINEEMTGWRLENATLISEKEPDSLNLAVKKFVDEKPRDPVSLLLISNYYDSRANENGYIDLMNSLEGESKEPEWIKLAARADQLADNYSRPARLKSLVARSISKSKLDTIYSNKKNPIFIMFWETGHKERKELIDSLKVLEKQYPDSLRMIVDICLEPDSAGWRSAIRRDSLSETAKRLWMPLGLADSRIEMLQVNSLPFFIVFDSVGNQTFRGKEIKEAMKVYREMMPADTIKAKKRK